MLFKQGINKQKHAEFVKVIVMPAIIFIFRCFESLPTSSVQIQNDSTASFNYCMMHLELFRKYYVKRWNKYLILKKIFS